MRTYRHFLSCALIGAAGLGLFGCNRKQENKVDAHITISTPYNGSHTTSQSGISVALGDIDGDKDLDLIVGSPSHVRAYINTNGIFNPQIR